LAYNQISLDFNSDKIGHFYDFLLKIFVPGKGVTIKIQKVPRIQF